MTNDTYNIILDTQVFTYSINDTSNRLHINSEFININPEIECKYLHCNSYDSKYNKHFSILQINVRTRQTIITAQDSCMSPYTDSCRIPYL